MALSIGIVGLPNIGKSTVFNALAKEKSADSASYAFSTIEPNKAVVPIPDERVAKLAELVNPKKVTPATIEFVDIAGLAAGASKGEGLGNQFLGQIRECAVLLHVVRCFEDENVMHVSGKLDPIADIECINMELIFADLEQLERKIERLTKQAKGDKEAKRKLGVATHLKEHLEGGAMASTFEDDDISARDLLNELQPLTAKPMIYVANVDEDGLSGENPLAAALHAFAANEGAEAVTICAKVEEEMIGLSDDEREEFLQSMGAEESGLDQVVHASYRALDLITFLTAGPKEVHAWMVPKGASAPKAAGVIHSDIERGFIRAEVIRYEAYVEHGSENAAKAAGKMSLEGKAYEVQEGDVIYFRFNV